MFRKSILSVLFFSIFCLSLVSICNAKLPDQLDYKETFSRGKILELVKENSQTLYGITTYTQVFKVQILEGKEKGKIIEVQYSSDPKLSKQKLNVADTVVIDAKPNPDKVMQYFIYEPYRLNNLLYLALGFLLLIGFVAGKKGLGAIIGLLVSFAIIGFWIIPQILKGADPLGTIIFASFVILIITTYIAHGVSIKTSVAIIGTLISLIFAGYLSVWTVNLLHVVGLGNEDIYSLQVGTPFPINAQGILLGGIIIGTLGALNDITTTQSITMFTLVRKNPKQKLIDLFEEGMVIGKEHIASLVNTLVLAYAGSSLAVLITFELNPAQLPWWVILNNESTMQEIVRSLVGASALILAVPITTILAAWVARKKI